MSVQTGEQPLTRYQGTIKCRYGYGRAAETVHQGDTGQDFAGGTYERKCLQFCIV
ncbi:hypothetical protein Q0F98_31930 [Paenibacillus amylolyticus]|nr:hypothetical protein Q0F98_31930 [Paenibacillus amylolyticus]